MTKPCHIVLLAENFGAGGVQKVSIRIANVLAESGCKVTYLALRNEGHLQSELSENVERRILTKRFRLPAVFRACKADRQLWDWVGNKRFRKGFYFANSLAEYLNSAQPDIVLSGDMRTNCVAVLARTIGGTRMPFVGSLGSHCIALSELAQADKLERPWPRLLSHSCLSRLDAVITASQGLEEEIAELLGSSTQVKAIYNPIVSKAMRSSAELPPGDPWFQDQHIPIILSMGRLSPVKDFETLLRAFALSRQKQPCRLVILGFNKSASGQRVCRDKLEKLAAQLGIERDFAILPVTDNPYSYLQRASLLAVSSLSEGFGNVLVEALFFGLPVVSTDCPSGPREILDNGRYGALVPVGDHVALANAISDALDKGVNRERQIARAQCFSVGKAGEAYLQLFQSLLDQRRQERA